MESRSDAPALDELSGYANFAAGRAGTPRRREEREAGTRTRDGGAFTQRCTGGTERRGRRTGHSEQPDRDDHERDEHLDDREPATAAS